MNSSVLYKRSKFFVDAFNVLIHVDLFIYHELKYRMENGDELLSILFKDKFPKINATNSNDEDTIVIGISANKKHQNILLDWVTPSKYDPDSLNMDFNMFIATLYHDILFNPLCDEYLQLTEFGNTIKLLTVDNNLNQLDIWVPFPSNFVFENLTELFAGIGATKIHFLVGNKSAYLTDSNMYDSYSFENVSDIDNYISRRHVTLTEVIIPTYEYNMVLDRTNVDRLLEQVTYHKLNLKESSNYYKENYNLTINTMTTPI